MIRPCLTALLAAFFLLAACGPDGAFVVNEGEAEGDNNEIDANGTQSDRAAKAQSTDDGDNDNDDGDDKDKKLNNNRELDPKGILGDDDDDDVKQAIAACRNTTVTTVTRSIFIPQPDTQCDWEVNGNLSKLDGIVRARREQFVSLDIPSDATLCGAEFDFPEQDQLYDDEILLTLNGVVLAASQDYSRGAVRSSGQKIFPTGMEMIGDFVIYDWEKIIGKVYEHNYSPQFCLGGNLNQGTCQIPPTETRGRIRLEISPELMTRVGLLGRVNSASEEGDDVLEAISRAPKNKIGWVTTGDNNNSDCKHLDVRFDVKLRYVRD